jgi:hypothetical protein
VFAAGDFNPKNAHVVVIDTSKLTLRFDPEFYSGNYETAKELHEAISQRETFTAAYSQEGVPKSAIKQIIPLKDFKPPKKQQKSHKASEESKTLEVMGKTFQVDPPDKRGFVNVYLQGKLVGSTRANSPKELEEGIKWMTTNSGTKVNDISLETAMPRTFAAIRDDLQKRGMLPKRVKLLTLNSGNYDVLKVSVRSLGLENLNRLVGLLPNEDSHRVYSPHMTIAYLKPGTGAKYLKDPSFLEWQDFVFTKLTFSNKEREHTELALNCKQTRKPGPCKSSHVRMLDPNSLTLRETGQTPEDVTLLAGQIGKKIHTAITAYEEGGKTFVIDGHHRVLAAKMNKIKVPTILIPKHL